MSVFVCALIRTHAHTLTLADWACGVDEILTTLIKNRYAWRSLARHGWGQLGSVAYGMETCRNVQVISLASHTAEPPHPLIRQTTPESQTLTGYNGTPMYLYLYFFIQRLNRVANGPFCISWPTHWNIITHRNKRTTLCVPSVPEGLGVNPLDVSASGAFIPLSFFYLSCHSLTIMLLILFWVLFSNHFAFRRRLSGQ